MDITPPRVGTGTEALKKANARSEVRQTPRVEPKRKIPSTEEWHEQPAPQLERRKGGDRRKGDRRRHDGHSPLDTRSHHERRTTVRRQADRDALARQAAEQDEEAPTPSHGVDTFA